MAAALPFIGAGSALLGAIGSIAGDKGDPIEMKAQESPELTEYRKKMLAYLGTKIGQGATPNPWLTQPNSPGMQAMNQISSMFYGKGINIPGGYGGQQQGPMPGQMPGGMPMPNIPPMQFPMPGQIPGQMPPFGRRA